MVFEENIIFSANEEIGSHSVTKYDELSVTVSWDVQVADAKFEVPIVRGMAYATAFYEKLSPKVTIPNMVSVNDQNSGTVSGIKTLFKKFSNIYKSLIRSKTHLMFDTYFLNLGSRFEIKLNNNQFWILYASSDITFNIDSGEKALTATGIKFCRLLNHHKMIHNYELRP